MIVKHVTLLVGETTTQKDEVALTNGRMMKRKQNRIKSRQRKLTSITEMIRKKALPMNHMKANKNRND